MKLKPKEPPGHARRKLRGYVTEIARLRGEGYSIRAIHDALTDAGVAVAWATVQREVARLATPRAAPPPKKRKVKPTAVKPAMTEKEQPKAGNIEGYFERYETNPLFRKKGRKTL